MADLLVKLYDIEDCPELIKELDAQHIHIVRVLSPDKFKVLDFIRSHFSEGWCSECEAGFYNTPVSVFAAVTEGKVIGFAAYDATARGFFGPTGVDPAYRRRGVGRALMIKCLLSMREYGYGYAVIGWAAGSAKHFYETYAGAVEIPDSFPGVYSRYINVVCKNDKEVK
ncbi:MAG: GNAT family N-acetyltransferase [Clostridia bacterium]|nr:GNAT family N-acetyltransferase [Clostridia bacterium]